MDSFYIHVGGVRVRLDLPYGARDPIGAHGMDELKAEPRDGRTKGRTYEGLLPCFRNRYRLIVHKILTLHWWSNGLLY